MKLYENSIFHYFFIDLDAPTWKNKMSSSICRNFITNILLNSTRGFLSNDMLIVFFGYAVAKVSLFKIAFLIWNTIEILKVVLKFHISLFFHLFECTDFKNSNLFGFVSNFYDEYFVEKYIIQWDIDNKFWIPGCKIFHY